MRIKKRDFIFIMAILVSSLIGVIADSVFACRISVLLLMILCLIRGRREKNLLNPYMLFLTVPFSLLIYADISRYTGELTVSTWILAIIHIAAFIAAVDLTPRYRHLSRCTGPGSGTKLKRWALLFTVLSVLPSVYSMLTGRTMPLAYIFSILCAPGVACAMKSKKAGLMTAVVLLNVASWAVYVTKSTILMFIISVLVSYEKYCLKTVRQKRVFAGLSVFALLVMLLSFSFANQGRENSSGQAAVDYFTKYGGLVWNGNAAFMMPYMYLTTPWYNLQYVMETQDTRTYGLWLLKPLLGYLQLDGYFTDSYTLMPYSSFNTFGFITYHFKDFGYLGSCLSTLLLGFFVKKIYSRYRVSRSPLDAACYALTAQAVVEMFFSNHFLTVSYPFTIVIVMELYKLLCCRGCRPELETGGEKTV